MRWIYIILVFVPVRSYYFNSTGTAENLIRTPCTDKNHFFLAPGVLTAGGTNRACISRFYPDGPARMLLTLISEDNKTVTASRELPPGDGGCLDISVPLLPNTKAVLVVNIWYPEVKCTWERRVTLRIASGRVVVVHTERARYRPGETVRARVFALKADLTPAPGYIEEIWIEGPPGAWEGTRVAQWTNVRSRMGLAQVQHDTDELAPPGRWTVRAKLGDGSQGSAVFWVGNYELPPFQLTVRHAPKVLRTSERLVWTVCVRYPWTEAVEGMLVIRVRGAGGGEGGEGGAGGAGGIRTAVRLKAPRACHRHAAAARRVPIAGEHPPDVVVAHFSFQEEGTRVWQNTTVVSHVVDKPISLEIVTKQRTLISPGLPYKLKVKATRWDDKPAQNERIRVCRFASNSDQATETNIGTCVSGDTDSNGVAGVMFSAEEDNSPFYRFEASLANDSAVSAGPVWLRSRGLAGPAQAALGSRGPAGPAQAALGPLRAEPRGTRTFVPLYLTLRNLTAPLTVHFVVITRGGIIYRWGATTQCPIASPSLHIQTASRNSKCNDPMAQYNEEQDQDVNEHFEDRKENDIRDSYVENNTQNDKDRNQYGSSSAYINKNNYGKDKNGRSYDASANIYIENHKYNNISSDYIIRNMNQNDKNNYFNKNIEINDKNHTIYDRFSAVFVKPNVYDKVNDVNTVQGESNASDSLLDRHLLRVMLPIKVTQQMCPNSHLIAYFYYNGEFVSASKHFEMDDCFVNKVEATFLSRQAQPGSQTTLQITTPGPALCALTALDSAAKWNSHNSVKEVLVKGLRKMIDGHRNVTEYDAAGDCFYSAEDSLLPANSLEQTAAWLAAAGVRTVGEITMRKDCDAPASLIDEGTVPRSDFSEAWLWRLVAVGVNGTVLTTAKAPDSITRYEANAVCLSKTGVAVSQPAVLQVFREFFIHADGPRRLRRGDSTIIRYRIFNYLYEPLSVQIQMSTSEHLSGGAEGDVVESVCVGARSSAARRRGVGAVRAGGASLALRARAVRDRACGNYTRGAGVSDEVIMKILVEPEGVPVQEHKSMMLCGKDNSNSSKSETMWKWSPAAAVPGTESLVVWATGDIVGPLLADADSLVLLPRGCGEQNMARAAANLLALAHLDPRSAAALAAREHVIRGFTRQLQYVHPAGGFSAFGASDAASSTWLTAFSLRYLRRAHQVLWPNDPMPPAIEKAGEWLLNQQMENGCFRNEGQVFHRELRGGLNEEGEIASVALTAYVMSSLVESPSPLPSRALRSSLSCLRALPRLKYPTPARVYAHALLAYAFVKLNKYEENLRRTNEAKYEDLRRSSTGKLENLKSFDEGKSKGGLKEHEGLLEVMELLKMAKRDGEYLWWETDSLATSIEATSYALLALRDSPAALREVAAPAVMWLAAHRGPSGGFLSTQDTLVALEALSAWSSLQKSPSNLTVTATSGNISKTARLDPGVHVPEVLKMAVGDKLSIAVEGSGCALVQATRRYNTLTSDPALHKGLSVQLSVHTDGAFDCDATATYCFCAAVIEACAVWSGPFPEMALLEISLPGGYGADAAKLYSQLHQPDSLLRRIELSPSGSRATLYLSGEGSAGDGVGGTLGGGWGTGGHACFSVHAVGPRAHTRPAYVRLSDYYSPHLNDTQIYTIPEECPSRVSHEWSQDLTSDNLYNKARSRSDSGEILITHEFSFEDIPEGIPLDDPLYDNLTREKANLRTRVNSTVKSNHYKKNNFNVDALTDIPNSNRDSLAVTNVIVSNKNEIKTKDIVEVDDKLDINNNDNAHATHPNDQNKIGLNTNEEYKSIIQSIYKHSDNDKALHRNHQATASTDIIKNRRTNEDCIANQKIHAEKQRTISTTKIVTEENIPSNTDQINTAYTETPKPNHRIEIRDEHESQQVENPKLTDFHVIDSEKDLEVPSGLEGPIPAVVLPPMNFVPQYLTPPNSFVPQENYMPSQNRPKHFSPAHNYGPEIFVPSQSMPKNYASAQDYRFGYYVSPSPQNIPSELFYTNQNVNMQEYLRRRSRNNYSSG